MSRLKYAALGLVLALGFSAHAAEEAKKKDPKDMKADEANAAGFCPVCKGESKPVYHYEYKGKTYVFRTRDCQKQFAADPAKFGAVGESWKPDSKPDEKKDDKKPAK